MCTVSEGTGYARIRAQQMCAICICKATIRIKMKCSVVVKHLLATLSTCNCMVARGQSARLQSFG